MPEYTTETGLVVKGEIGRPRKTLAEVIDLYDIVDIDEAGAIIATERGHGINLAATETVDTRELGTTGYSSWSNYLREEYNAELRGREGLVKYDRMRRSDAQVRQSLRIIKTPVVGARWFVQPVSTSKRDVKVADFITEAYMKRMSMSWWQMQVEQLLCLDFGWYAFEKVFKVEDDQIWWQKLAPRHPLDAEQWVWDSHGGPNGIWFYGIDGTPDATYISIDKLLVFTFDKEAGNMEGISVLRSAYAHWYIKQNLYKIDAIQKERHSIGIPVIKLPAGYTSADKELANNMGRNLRTNEKAHVVLPPFWTLEFASTNTQPVDSLTSISHHNHMILANVLAGFMDATIRQGDTTPAQDMFQKGSRFIADVVRDIHNKWAIPELVRKNFGTNVEPPELKVRRLGDTVDWRTLSFAIRNLIGAKVMTPSPELEEWFRDEMDLPPMTEDDKAVALRQIAQMGLPPQVPGGSGDRQNGADNPGQPRQSTAQNMQQQAQGTGKSNAGQDGSGSAQGN